MNKNLSQSAKENGNHDWHTEINSRHSQESERNEHNGHRDEGNNSVG